MKENHVEQVNIIYIISNCKIEEVRAELGLKGNVKPEYPELLMIVSYVCVLILR
jgi:hypothetical protein